MNKISTNKAPAAIGPYSQAVKSGNLLFTSGQIALDPATGEIVGATIQMLLGPVNGEMKDVLIEKTKKMNKVDKIMFLGEIENPLPILKRSQLLVLPSFSEAYPTILLEALCLYIPVLSTPTKGAKEILNNMAGTYISNDYYNIEEFAKLMENGVKEKLDPQLVDRKISLNFIDVIGFRIQYEIIEN